jgi:glycine/D-amino acid oxidase-like deaminating enzyme
MLNELGFAGGSYCPADGYLNQHRVVHGLARAAESAGATIECGVEVVGFDLEADRIGAILTTKGTLRTDIVVNCAGAWAPHLAERIGLQLPIRSRRVQLLHAHPRVPLPPELPWLIGPLGQVHVRQEGFDRVQVGGFLGTDETVSASAFDHAADPAWISAVLAQADETFGIAIERSSVLDSCAGLYPTTPDQHPIIDRTDRGMIVVGGFAGLGLMHAPAAGLLAAELIVDGKIADRVEAAYEMGTR